MGADGCRSLQAGEAVSSVEHIVTVMVVCLMHGLSLSQVIGRPRLVLRQQASEEQLALLVAMGFPQDQARHALQTAHGNLGSAIQLLTSAQ